MLFVVRESCRSLIVLLHISTNRKYSPNGKYSSFVWKYIHTKGEVCLLVGEFYPFVGIDSTGGINYYDERIKFYVIMVVGIISDEGRNFSISIKIYRLKRWIFSVHGKWYRHSTYTYVFCWSAIKLEIANGVLCYRFQRTDEILRLCENIFTKKESFVRSFVGINTTKHH